MTNTAAAPQIQKSSPRANKYAESHSRESPPTLPIQELCIDIPASELRLYLENVAWLLDSVRSAADWHMRALGSAKLNNGRISMHVDDWKLEDTEFLNECVATMEALIEAFDAEDGDAVYYRYEKLIGNLQILYRLLAAEKDTRPAGPIWHYVRAIWTMIQAVDSPVVVQSQAWQRRALKP